MFQIVEFVAQTPPNSVWGTVSSRLPYHGHELRGEVLLTDDASSSYQAMEEVHQLVKLALTHGAALVPACRRQAPWP